jgi:stage IV sporulation protein B
MVASSQNVKPGNAYIYSTVDGSCPKRYNIEIVKVDRFNKEHKNYVIKVTDEALISETGGIVQGMSGSPIVQEGKLVGAVTHVFLNDPTRGYGIDIKQMLNE